MKKSNYGKKYLFSRKNITHNEKLAFFVCLPITAISLMMCAIIVLIPKTNTTIQEPHQNIIEEKKPGRQELPDDQKSDKTLANRESMS